MENQIPAVDPSEEDSMAGMLRGMMRKMLMSVDGMLPAEVVSYDRKSNRATVKPSISLLTSGGDTVPRAPLASIPVLAIGGGEFVINFPLKPGDTGWIEASDRDISLFMQGGKEAQPNTMRLHSFSDGRFIPDVMAKYTIDPENEDAAMVIQNKDGTQCIALFPDKIKIKATTIEIDGMSNFTGAATMTGGLTIDGKVFGTHVHGGVEPGTGNTSGPA